jgi:AraC family transcriptional regulator
MSRVMSQRISRMTDGASAQQKLRSVAVTNVPACAATNRSIGARDPKVRHLRRVPLGGEADVAVADAIVSLLESARTALPRDVREATRCIERAATLLTINCDLRSAADFQPDASHLAPWQKNRVLKFVQENLSRQIRIREMANTARLSVSYFHRAFAAWMGETPNRYVRRRRIERAKTLMLSTEKCLAEIALDCGFSDQSHLTRLFRRSVGSSPATWRRAHCVGLDQQP